MFSKKKKKSWFPKIYQLHDKDPKEAYRDNITKMEIR